MARHRKISVSIWNDEKFCGLTDDAKLLFLYLLTHPYQTSLGAMKATMGGLADERGWLPERLSEAFGEVIKKGMAKYDAKARCVWLPNFLRFNGPESPNVVKAWFGALDLIPECNLKLQAIQRAKAILEGYDKGFQEAFTKAFDKAFPKGTYISAEHPLPNPEQEQEPLPEQEQEYAQDAREPVEKSRDPDPPTSGPASGKALDSFLVDDARRTQWLERVRSKYPQFAGNANWIVVAKNADRICELYDRTLTDLELSVERYAAYVRAGGASNPKYVKSPQNFFAIEAGGPWASEWKPPPTKAEQRLGANIDAVAEAKRQLLEEDAREGR